MITILALVSAVLLLTIVLVAYTSTNDPRDDD